MGEKEKNSRKRETYLNKKREDEKKILRYIQIENERKQQERERERERERKTKTDIVTETQVERPNKREK